MNVPMIAGLALSFTLAGPTPDPGVIQVVDPVCTPSEMPLADRASPFDSASVALAEGELKLCYGRPSARDRTMIGGDDVPFGEPWRLGANEPTTLHTTVAIRIGDVPLDPGSYSLYAIPGDEEWEIVVNTEVDRWGIPISPEVRAHDVGSVTVPRERPDGHVETLTIDFLLPDAGTTAMEVEWEDFRVSVPIEVTAY